MNKTEAAGTALALLTAVVSGVAIPLNKVFVVDMDPIVFTAVRALLIGLFFFFISGVQTKFDYSSLKKNWSWLLAIGFIGGGLAFMLFFSGLKLTTSGRGAFLHKTLPLYVALLAFIFLKEKISKVQWGALGVMLVGTFVIYIAQIGPGAMWSNPGLGDLLIIGATILWAVENVMARKVLKDGESNLIVTFARMSFGAVLLWGAVVLLGRWDAVLNLTMIQVRNMLISTGVLTAYVLFWYWSIKLINVSKAAALLLLSPVISLMIGVLWLGEPAPFMQLLGSMLILAGAAYVVNVKSRLATGV